VLYIGSTLEIIGLLGVYLCNIPLYIYRAVRAVCTGQKVPAYQWLFHVPEWLDDYVKFIGLGMLILFFVLIAIGK